MSIFRWRRGCRRVFKRNCLWHQRRCLVEDIYKSLCYDYECIKICRYILCSHNRTNPRSNHGSFILYLLLLFTVYSPNFSTYTAYNSAKSINFQCEINSKLVTRLVSIKLYVLYSLYWFIYVVHSNISLRQLKL